MLWVDCDYREWFEKIIQYPVSGRYVGENAVLIPKETTLAQICTC